MCVHVSVCVAHFVDMGRAPGPMEEVGVGTADAVEVSRRPRGGC